MSARETIPRWSDGRAICAGAWPRWRVVRGWRGRPCWWSIPPEGSDVVFSRAFPTYVEALEYTLRMIAYTAPQRTGILA